MSHEKKQILKSQSTTSPTRVKEGISLSPNFICFRNETKKLCFESKSKTQSQKWNMNWESLETINTLIQQTGGGGRRSYETTTLLFYNICLIFGFSTGAEGKHNKTK